MNTEIIIGKNNWLKIKRITQSIAMTLMFLLSLSNVIGFYIWRIHPFGYNRTFNYYRFVAPFGLSTHFILAFVLGFIGLLVSVNLFRYVRSAWIIAMVTQSVLLGLHLLLTGHVFALSTFISLFILIVLGATYKDFKRSSERLSLKRGLIIAAVPIAMALFNTILSMSILSDDYQGAHNAVLSFNDSLKFLFLMDTNLSKYTSEVHLFALSLIIVSWVCIVIAALLVLKPLVYNPFVSSIERKKTYDLVNRFGKNPMDYMTLMSDKHYFFGEMTEGVIAYVMVNNIMVICGDIICAKEDAVTFLSEIRRFAYKNNWKLLFMDITEEFRTAYEDLDFGMIKIGEDACVRLSEFTLSGKPRAKVRANINHAKKNGLVVKEYEPLKQRNQAVEHEINEISQEWFKQKGAEMGFMLGGLALENPLGRRYFYSENADGQMQAFIIFVPYAQGSGYMADVTRRRDAAPNGAMEIIFAQAFEKMAQEGVTWGNIGLCPLANMDKDDKSITTQLFQFVYENLNGVYGFKGLYQAKKKWAPTDWQPRYIAISPKTFGPNFAYAMIKAQNPKGINKMILEKLKIHGEN